MNKKIWLISCMVLLLFLGVGGYYLYLRQPERALTTDQSLEKIRKDRKDLADIRETYEAYSDEKKPDFLKVNAPINDLQKVSDNLLEIKKSIDEEYGLKGKEEAQAVIEVKQSYEETSPIYYNIQIRQKVQESLQELFVPVEIEMTDDGKTNSKNQERLDKTPLEALSVKVDDKGKRIASIFSINGKYIVNDLPVEEEASMKKIQSLKETLVEAKKTGYSSTGEWEKEVNDLVKIAETQIKEVEDIRNRVNSYFNKEVVKTTPTQEELDKLIADVSKVKNEKVKKDLKVKLDKLAAAITAQSTTTPSSTVGTSETSSSSSENNYVEPSAPWVPNPNPTPPPSSSSSVGGSSSSGSSTEPPTTTPSTSESEVPPVGPENPDPGDPGEETPE